MKILICGHRSFAAQDLPDLLRSMGHEVVFFSRGPVQRNDNLITGPVLSMHENPHLLEESFDAVVNYVLLKDDSIESNVAFVDSLLAFCKDRISHLVHIGSVSSFESSISVMSEKSPTETQFERKGAYGSIKAASDHRVENCMPEGTKLSMVRPGYILGEGMVHPFVGTGVRMPWNRLLVIGNGRGLFPVISRSVLDKAVLKVLQEPPQGVRDSLLLANPKSPTRIAYLRACCTYLGSGEGADMYPNSVWMAMAVAGEAVARLTGKTKMKPYLLLTSKLAAPTLDVRLTQQRLGMSMQTDWKADLHASMDGQQLNFDFPYQPREPRPTKAQNMTFLGYGRIVKTRHLPALKNLDFFGQVRAFDLQARIDEDGQVIQAFEKEQIEASDLFVVATPGKFHTSAIELLGDVKGAILVEKPLCYTSEELQQWSAFAASRPSPVLVCHNYRYKRNIMQMLDILRRYNPGRLRQVHLQFDSPPVSFEPAAWARDERRARTLLMDYGIHFLDVACLFGRGEWKLDRVRHELNSSGQTSLIEGRWQADNYGVSFLMRQGFGPRKVSLLFNFQNYSVRIGFFPDTCVPYMTDESAWLHKSEARAMGRAFNRKVRDMLINRDSDLSHTRIFSATLDNAQKFTDCIEVEQLRSFYGVLFETANQIYES